VRILFCERLRGFFLGEAANTRFRNESFKNQYNRPPVQQRQIFADDMKNNEQAAVFANNVNASNLNNGSRKNGPRQINLRS
jgi:hypothetical protein